MGRTIAEFGGRAKVTTPRIAMDKYEGLFSAPEQLLSQY